MIRLFLIACLILWFLPGISQKDIPLSDTIAIEVSGTEFLDPSEDPEKGKSAQHVLGSMHHAEEFINQGEFRKAKLELKAIVRKRPKMAVAHRMLGLVELELGNMENALEAYQTSFELNPKLSRAAYFECGEAMFRLSQFDEALAHFKIYDAMRTERYANAEKEHKAEKYFDVLLPVRFQNCQLIKEKLDKPVCEIPINLGPTINTPNDEYFPSLSSDGEWLLYTTRNRVYPDVLSGYNENIFISHNRDVRFGDGQPLKGIINTNRNEGLAKFTYGKRKIFLVSCQRDDVTRSCDIFNSELDKKGSFFLEEPPGFLNSDSWDSQPCLTCNEQEIYFSSNRPGGQGGADIWVSYFKSEKWTVPENLGPEINTSGDEEAPFISANGNSLYYTSNGLPGFGESDIFYSTKVEGKFSKPIHMGYPINTQFQETGIFVSANGKEAFLSSDRLEGKGGLDIYRFTMPEEFAPKPMVVVYGTVVDKRTGESLPAIVNALHEESRYSVDTNKEGYYSMCLPYAPSYAFHVDRKDYNLYVEAVLLKKDNLETAFNWEIYLDHVNAKAATTALKEKPWLEDDLNSSRMYEFRTYFEDSEQLVFYFNSGSSSLEEAALTKISNLSEFLLTNSWAKVSVKGFADDVGTKELNKDLSRQRAETVYMELLRLGVPEKQILLEGVGEVATDKSNVMQSRTMNRRVEISILN